MSIVTNSLSVEELVPGGGKPTDYHEEGIAAAWDRWHAAHTLQHKLCRRQQRLEKLLLTMVDGFPNVELTVPNRPGPVFARTAEDIDLLLAGPALDEARASAKAKLADARAAWDIADASIGYSVAFAAENEAYSRALALAEELWRAQARTIDDVIAKLHCLIEMEEPGSDFAETPWPQLRAILRDLLHLRPPA
ncbi:hypothetical protein PY650_33575 [Rhizobium calliandrae]|uniref:Uncharacterized protein n=1 Tax=Rhizobium calliandrae TaxID=1312182 RepID=A0ABT7KSG9_9HYPH|nr:hypothetical protein [Rhizobium calliandrae]MDL2410434.1 hypothetical protein [Rhizobium calliandrae]